VSRPGRHARLGDCADLAAGGHAHHQANGPRAAAPGRQRRRQRRRSTTMNDAILQLKNVKKQFGQTEIIRGLDLEVRKGERLAVIGPNGAGKSTVFHLISGRLAVTSGEIWFDGARIDDCNDQQIYQRGLSRSFQITNLFARQTVYENLLSAAMWTQGYRYTYWKRISRLQPLHERAQEVLERTGLTARRDIPVNLLTYAEQRALEIGMSIAGGGHTLLLDGPTAGMSRSESDA